MTSWFQAVGLVVGSLALGATAAVLLLQYVVLPLTKKPPSVPAASDRCGGVYLEEHQRSQVDSKLAELKKLNLELEAERSRSWEF